jgi:hypothetical protein
MAPTPTGPPRGWIPWSLADDPFYASSGADEFTKLLGGSESAAQSFVRQLKSALVGMSEFDDMPSFHTMRSKHLNRSPTHRPLGIGPPGVPAAPELQRLVDQLNTFQSNNPDVYRKVYDRQGGVYKQDLDNLRGGTRQPKPKPKPAVSKVMAEYQRLLPDVKVAEARKFWEQGVTHGQPLTDRGRSIFSQLGRLAKTHGRQAVKLLLKLPK